MRSERRPKTLPNWKKATSINKDNDDQFASEECEETNSEDKNQVEDQRRRFKPPFKHRTKVTLQQMTLFLISGTITSFGDPTALQMLSRLNNRSPEQADAGNTLWL
jgi:hypothetical protein